MRKGSTFVLRTAVICIGLIMLSICLVALPQAIIAELNGDFDYAPILIGLYIPVIPFFIALFQAMKLISYINRNTAFSDQSVVALKKIKLCAFMICGLFVAGMPYIFYVADRDDAPGLAALGFIIIGASFLIAMFAAVLQELLRNAINIKTENDLTV